MKSVANQHNWSIETVIERLNRREADSGLSSCGLTRAAVAMILNKSDDDLEILFIQRAAHNLDPWSGHIAFPGGKLEDSELECAAACRETLEEIGVDLKKGRYLGRLSDIVGANLSVRVSCCIFLVDRLQNIPILNEEVSDLFWVTISDLRDQRRHQECAVVFGERIFEVSAINLPVENKPVLWGITYRLVMQFLSIIEDNVKLPEMVEID